MFGYAISQPAVFPFHPNDCASQHLRILQKGEEKQDAKDKKEL